MDAFVPSIYAIDFGTSNSLLAAVAADGEHRLCELSPDGPDPTVLRSVLFFTPDGGWCFGADAIREYARAGAQGRLFRSIKKYLPDVDFRGTRVGRTRMTLTDLIAVFLREMRTRANRRFGVDVKRVLLGRPARFADDDQREQCATERLRDAAVQAGFDEVRLLPEPLAAARDFRSALTRPALVLVVDLGAGTSDFTVLRLRPDGYSPDDVLAIGGVSVAGDAVDGAIMRGRIAVHFGSRARYRVPLGRNLLEMPVSLVDALCSPADAALLERRDIAVLMERVHHGSVSEADRAAVERLICVGEDRLGYAIFRAIERTKLALSDQAAAEFRFEYPGMDVRDTLTRDDLAQLGDGAVSSILRVLDDTLERAGVTGSDIERVCLTGGTGKLLAIRSALSQRFGPALVSHRTFHSVVGGLAEAASVAFRGAEVVS